MTLQQRLPSRWALRSMVRSGRRAMTRYGCWRSWRASTSSSASWPGHSRTTMAGPSRWTQGRTTGPRPWSNCCPGTRVARKSLARLTTFTAQGYCGACAAGHRHPHCLDRWTDRHQPPRQHRRSPRSDQRHPRGAVRVGSGTGPRPYNLAGSAAVPAVAFGRAVRGTVTRAGVRSEGAGRRCLRESPRRCHGGA